MSASRTWSRSLHRAIHLVFALVLGVSIYSPLSDLDGVVLLVQAVVFPGLTLSGILLWKGHRVRQWYRNHRTSPE